MIWLMTAAVLLGASALLSFVSVLQFGRHIRRHLTPVGNRTRWPRVLVITPFKGTDPGFEDNLRSVLTQDYPEYVAYFVTGEDDDSGCPVVSKLINQYPHGTLLVAGMAKGCSQMIHNQLHALSQMPRDVEAVVVCDSDLRLRPDTLKDLVAPLDDPKVGVTFGYPYYLPPKNDLASNLRSLWNAYGALFLADPSMTYPWGGLFAMRRELVERLDVPRVWDSVLTDDFPLGDAVRQADLSLMFVPQALVPSHEGGKPLELIRWTNKRQIIMRVYHPALWARIALGLTIGKLLPVAFTVAGGILAHRWIEPALLLAGWFAAEQAAFALFSYDVARILPEAQHYLRAQILRFSYVGPLALLLSLCNTVVSACTRKVSWRGVEYRLDAHGHVRTARC